MCLSIGTAKTFNFPFVANVKLIIIFRCQKIWAHYSLIIMCSNIGTNGKLMVQGVPVLKHFMYNYLSTLGIIKIKTEEYL